MKIQKLLATVAVMSFIGSAQAEISNGTVKIGVLTDMSGPYADNVGAGSVLAAKMAVEDFGGKAAGMPVEVISADHQNKADIGASLAKRWVDVDKVDVILDVPFSSVACGQKTDAWPSKR